MLLLELLLLVLFLVSFSNESDIKILFSFWFQARHKLYFFGTGFVFTVR